MSDAGREQSRAAWKAVRARRQREPWTCPRCHSHEWIQVSLTRGMSFQAQCVPCGQITQRPPLLAPDAP